MNGFKLFSHDEAELFLDAGLAIPSRTVYLGSEAGSADDESGVDYRMAAKAIKSLHILNSISNDDITIILNNYGGDEYHGLAIYDAIKTGRSKTRIVSYGSAMSMGSVILQAGDQRILAPNATLMVHMGDLQLNVDQRDLGSLKKEYDRVNYLINQIYLDRIREKNPRYSINQLRELLSTDSYMSAKESVDLGLADNILQ